MFGPGVSTMPNEIRAKPSREVRWGMVDSRAGSPFVARADPRSYFVDRADVGRIFPKEKLRRAWINAALNAPRPNCQPPAHRPAAAATAAPPGTARPASRAVRQARSPPLRYRAPRRSVRRG